MRADRNAAATVVIVRFCNIGCVRRCVARRYGSPDTLTVEIRKPGGQQWDVDSVRYTIGHRRSGAEPRAKWVRYIVGHEYEGAEPIDVAIDLPKGSETVSAPGVFGADEAGEIFFSYYKIGDIPTGYVLRPVEGYTADHEIVDLRGVMA